MTSNRYPEARSSGRLWTKLERRLFATQGCNGRFHRRRDTWVRRSVSLEDHTPGGNTLFVSCARTRASATGTRFRDNSC